MIKQPSKKDEFVKRALEIHGGKYLYDKVEEGCCWDDTLTITCLVHGDFKQTKGAHLSGKGCKLCGNGRTAAARKLSTQDFLEKGIVVHGGKYNYDKVDVKSATVKVKIVCPIHGEFAQTPANHLYGQGCPKCGRENSQNEKRLSTEKFIEKAKAVHGDKYDYSESVYGNSNADKVTIKCNSHGSFTQAPSKHLSGNGCPVCKKEKMQDKPNAWSYTSWEAAGKQSANFEGYSLYIIECSSTSTNERFIKVGKTFVGIPARFKGSENMPYKYKVLTQVYHNAFAISKLEDKIKRELKEYKYIPKKEFGGMHECLDESCKAEAIRIAEE